MTSFVKAFSYSTALLAACGIFLLNSAGAETQKVFFKNLKDGDKVTSPVKVEMGVEGMKVGVAGPVNANEGHHHIIVDGGPMEKGMIIPADATHLHFGKGQTEAEVTLPPGKHTLTLQFADGSHGSYGKAMSSTVSVEVVGKN